MTEASGSAELIQQSNVLDTMFTALPVLTITNEISNKAGFVMRGQQVGGSTTPQAIWCSNQVGRLTRTKDM
jgi:hypothetical protein